MRSLRKLGSGLTALALCFLLTGFFGGGEKPQDCINAMIKAIDNNDSKSFGERVPLEFWISMASIMNDEFQNSMKTAMSFIDGPAGANNFTSALSSAITPSVKRMAETAQETIRKQIDAGRTGMEKNSPWTSDTLSKVTASEAGTGAEADTATAVMELDGMKLTLGLAKINDKWILLGVGGNRKSALDTTLVLKKQREQRAAELAQRRKGNEQWLKEFGSIYEEAMKIEDEKYLTFISKAMPTDFFMFAHGGTHYSVYASDLNLESPQFWDSVELNLRESMRAYRADGKTNGHWLSKDDCKNYKTERTEVVFQKGDILITKSLTSLHGKVDHQERAQEYEQWLSGADDGENPTIFYLCFIKKEGRWLLIGKGFHDNRRIVEIQNNERTEKYANVDDCSYIPETLDIPFTSVEYLTELAKRYPDLKKKAEQTLASEPVWKDSLQKTMKSIDEAVTRKNSKVLATLVDIPVMLRNRDTVEATAQWRLTQTENDADVKAFIQEIDKGELSAENPLNGLNVADAVVNFIGEKVSGVVAGKHYLLFKRASSSDPWKLRGITLKAEALSRPEDWEKQVEENMVKLRASKERAAKQVAVLATLLSEKQGEKFVQNIDMATLTYWDPNASSFAFDQDVRLIEAIMFPDMLQIQRQAVIDSVNTTGTCELNGIKVSSDILKQANLTIYGHGGLGVSIAERVLWFVPVSEDAIRLVSTAAISGESTKNTFVKEGENSYERIQNNIAKNGGQYLKQAAMTSCIDAILDTVQISAQKYTVFQGMGMKYNGAFNNNLLVLEMDLEINTTNTQPCSIDNMRVIFTDETGGTTYQEDWDVKNIKIEPYRSTREALAVTLSESAMYWLQQVRDKKARISFRPLSVGLGNKTYSEKRQKDLLEDIRSNADGTWQLGTFPPVKPRFDILKTRPEEADAALKALRDEHKAKETARLNEIKQVFIDKVIVEYAPSSRTLTLRNTLVDGVAIKELLVQTFENGVVKDSKTIPLQTDVRANHTETIENINIPVPAGSSLKVRVAEMKVGYDWGEKKIALHSGVVPPLLYQADPILFTLTAEQATGKVAPKTETPAEAPKTEAPKAEAPAEPKAEAPKAEAPAEAPKVETPAEAPKTEAPKAETPKAEALKAETPATATATASGATTATDTPTPPEGKNSGKAVLGSTTLDLVGSAFGPDGKPDSAIRVSVHNPSPLVAVRIDNIGGTMASWKTSGVKTSAKGVIAVVKDGKPLNAANAAFSLDVAKPVVLDLLVQDTGVIAEGKTRLRAVFHHADGKRSYAILEAANK